LKDYLVAIVVPNFDNLAVWCKSHGKVIADNDQVCQDRQVVELVLDSLLTIGNFTTHPGCEANFSRYELVRSVHLHPKPFSTKDDLLTPGQTLKRRSIACRFALQLKGLYTEFQQVVS